MSRVTMYSLILCLSMLGVQGFSMEFEEDDYDEREGRIFTSGGSLNLNSTFLTAAGEINLKQEITFACKVKI